MFSDRNLTIVEMLLEEGPEVATMNPTVAFFPTWQYNGNARCVVEAG